MLYREYPTLLPLGTALLTTEQLNLSLLWLKDLHSSLFLIIPLLSTCHGQACKFDGTGNQLGLYIEKLKILCLYETGFSGSILGSWCTKLHMNKAWPALVQGSLILPGHVQCHFWGTCWSSGATMSLRLITLFHLEHPELLHWQGKIREVGFAVSKGNIRVYSRL